MMPLDYDALLKETTFAFSRSGGKGGQNVNKVETRVELTFNIEQSQLLTDDIKYILHQKLANKLDSSGTLHISASAERSQLANRKKAEEKFIALIQQALRPTKKRKATAPSKAAKRRRLESKKQVSTKKKQRQERFF